VCLKVVSPSLSTGSVTSPAQLVATNLPVELAAKLKEINPSPSNNMGIIDVAARIKVCWRCPVLPVAEFTLMVCERLQLLNSAVTVYRGTSLSDINSECSRERYVIDS